MAARSRASSFQDIAITRQRAWRNPMHPLGMYLAISDSQRNNGWDAADARRTPFARVDAPPLLEPEHASRMGRLAAAVRLLATHERVRVVESLFRRPGNKTRKSDMLVESASAPADESRGFARAHMGE